MPGGGVPLGQHDLRLGECLVDLLPVEDAGHVAEGGHVAGPAVSRVTCHASRESPDGQLARGDGEHAAARPADAAVRAAGGHLHLADLTTNHRSVFW